MLKAVLLSMALPPICFLYLTIFGLLMAKRHRRSGRVLACIGLVCLTALSLPVVATSMILGLESNLPTTPPPDAMPQAIVILSGDMTRIADPPFVSPGLLTLDRLRAGAALQRRTGLPVLVTGGILQDDRPPIAGVMADSLRDDFNVPVTWVEPASADTWENAAFSAAILKKQNIRSIYVVTQGWHMRRALLAFRQTGLIVTAAPTSVDAPLDYILSDFVPRASAWGLSYFALHEWIGCVWYSLR